MRGELFRLIHSLDEDGISLDISENQIVCRGNRDKVRERLPTIRPHKPELLRLITGKPSSKAGIAEVKFWIQKGWRAEFSRPDEKGNQVITWLKPGAWSTE